MVHTLITKHCRILFPDELISTGFIASLCERDVKSAFRKQAFANHPDTTKASSIRFHEVKDAYSALLDYIKSRGRHTSENLPRSYQQRNRDLYRYRPIKAAHTAPAANKRQDGTFYKGELPTFRLKTGLFLYHRGLIPYEALVDAMIWQQKTRARIGEMAVSMGWISEREIDFIRAATEISGGFGERAIAIGLLTREQVDTLLRYQKLSLCQLGQFFVKQGYLSHGELKRELRLLRLHNESAGSSEQNHPIE